MSIKPTKNRKDNYSRLMRAGLWSLPGGFVEHDEIVEESLAREIEEETGLKVKPTRVVGVYSHPLRSPVKHVVTICYECTVLEGELKAHGENTEAKFFAVDSLPKLAFDHEKILRYYLKLKNAFCNDEEHTQHGKL